MGALHGLVGQVDLRGEDGGEPVRNALSTGKISKPFRLGRFVEDDANVNVRGVVGITPCLRSKEGEMPHTHAFKLGPMGTKAGKRGGGIDLHRDIMARNVPQRQRYRPGVLTRARR